MRRSYLIYTLMLTFVLISCSTVKDDGNPTIDGQQPSGGVVVQDGDTLNEQGFIKPELGSPTTKQFIEKLQNTKFRTLTGEDSTIVIEEMVIDINGTFTSTSPDLEFTLHSLKTPNIGIYYATKNLLNSKTDQKIIEAYFAFDLQKQSKLSLFKVINQYTADKPLDGNDNIESWNQYYQKKYSFDNIDWDKASIVASAQPTESEITEYVLNTKYFIYSDTKDLIINAETGDFSDKDDTTYTLYYVIDKTTAKYTDGKIYGIRANAFGEITPETDLIQNEIAIKGSTQEEKDQYVASVRLKNFIYSDTKDLIINAETGDFSDKDDTTYTLYYVIDKTTAKYTDGKIYGIRANAFGEITPETDLIQNEIAIKGSTQEEKDQYVASVRLKNFIHTDESDFIIENNGDFSEYKLYYVIDNNTAKYTDGKVYGVRGERFGTIDATSSEIIVGMFITRNQHKIDKYVNTINTKLLESVENGSEFKLTIDGSFTFDGVNYVVDSIIDDNTALYTKPLLLLFKQTLTFSLIGEFFGRVETGTIVEKVASTYDYRIVKFVDSVNNSDLTDIQKLTPFTLNENGTFNRSDTGQLLTPKEIYSDTHIEYSDGRSYKIEEARFGYTSRNEFTVVAMYATQELIDFSTTINNANLTDAGGFDFRIPLSGDILGYSDTYILKKVINSTSAEYTYKPNSGNEYTQTIGLRQCDQNLFFGVLRGGVNAKIDTSKVVAVNKYSQREYDEYNTKLQTMGMINYDLEPYTLEQLQLKYDIISFDIPNNKVFTKSIDFPRLIGVIEIKDNALQKIKAKYLSDVLAKIPSEELANVYNNHISSMPLRFFRDYKKLELTLNHVIKYNDVSYTYFYSRGEDTAIYTYQQGGVTQSTNMGVRTVRTGNTDQSVFGHLEDDRYGSDLANPAYDYEWNIAGTGLPVAAKEFAQIINSHGFVIVHEDKTFEILKVSDEGIFQVRDYTHTFSRGEESATSGFFDVVEYKDTDYERFVGTLRHDIQIENVPDGHRRFVYWNSNNRNKIAEKSSTSELANFRNAMRPYDFIIDDAGTPLTINSDGVYYASNGDKFELFKKINNTTYTVLNHNTRTIITKEIKDNKYQSKDGTIVYAWLAP